MPTYKPVSLAASQNEAIAGNQAALPADQSLAKGVTDFNKTQLTSLLNSIMPGWSENAAKTSANIGDELAGKIPKDVADAVQSSSAAQALTGGFGGSGLAGNLTAKDLGLTSLNLMQQGQSAEESWSALIDRMFAPGMGNIESMFISPMQQFQASTTNAENVFNAQWLKAQVAAQPDPVLGAFNPMSALKAYGGVAGGLSSSGIGTGSGAGGVASSGGIAADGSIMSDSGYAGWQNPGATSSIMGSGAGAATAAESAAGAF